jgi:SP family arabinose:H+ symporter-like MFS transporter
MNRSPRFTATVAFIVALGGFLMGFDASVISGVVGFIETEFRLTKLQLGWSVASLTLAATFAMLVAGPLSDRIGRRPVLKIAAALFAISAIASAAAPGYVALVLARMIGGLGVGAALIVAPMYIAEIAPSERRGRLVSFNQLNIVIGISVAFFSNYLILNLGQSGFAWTSFMHFDDWNWRWMLGVEALPAIVYFAALAMVPESPRWLVMQGRDEDALQVFARINGPDTANKELAEVRSSLGATGEQPAGSVTELFRPAMRLVLTVGLVIAVLQQITGINAVFFYAPIIFEQSGIGTDAAFLQAVLVGLVNLAFTIIAMLSIDKLGRRPLLIAGLAGIAACMLMLSYGFGSATYSLQPGAGNPLPAQVDPQLIEPIVGQIYDSDASFRAAVSSAIGNEVFRQVETKLVSAAIDVDSGLILLGIVGFVASFAVSLGPVMWVLFSELFPNRIRAMAVSLAGLVKLVGQLHGSTGIPMGTRQLRELRDISVVRPVRPSWSRLRGGRGS